jgi:protein-L-isoaspartate(D-aspartate) O-methyltransferase
MWDWELEVVRRAYAKQVLAAAELTDARLEAALATVRREDFLGPGPWPIVRQIGPSRRYVPAPSAGPVYLYSNDAIGILPERNLTMAFPRFTRR